MRTRTNRAGSTAQSSNPPLVAPAAASAAVAAASASSQRPSKTNTTSKNDVPASDRNGHIIAYTDPGSVWPRVSPLLLQRLPLRDVTWQTNIEGMKSFLVPQVGVKFLPESETHFEGEESRSNTYRCPSLFVFFVDGDARDEFKKVTKKLVQDWVTIRSNQSYLIVVVNSLAQQTKLFQTPVIEQMKSIIPRKDRLVGLRLNEPGQEQWHQLLKKIKEGLVESFEANLTLVSGEAERIYAGHSKSGWRFGDLFLVKQSLAIMFEHSRMFSAAYGVYSDLRSLFQTHMASKYGPSDQSFKEGISDSSTAVLLEVRKDLRQLLIQKQLTRFDFEQYLFALQASVLLEMNDINKFLEDAKDFIGYSLDYLSKNAEQVSPGFIEGWVFTAAMTVANAALFAVSNASPESQSDFCPPKSPLLKSQPPEPAAAENPPEQTAMLSPTKKSRHNKSKSLMIDLNSPITNVAPSVSPSMMKKKKSPHGEKLFDAPREKKSDVVSVSLEHGAPVKLPHQLQALTLNLEKTGASPKMKDTLFYIADFFLIARSQLNKVAIALGISDNKGFLASLVQALQSLEIPEELLGDADGDMNDGDDDFVIVDSDDKSERSQATFGMSPSAISLTDIGSQSATGTVADGSGSFDSTSELGDDFSVGDISPVPTNIAPPIITRAFNGEVSVLSPVGDVPASSASSVVVREKVQTSSSLTSSPSTTFESQPKSSAGCDPALFRSARVQSGSGSNSGYSGTGSSGSSKSARTMSKSPSLLRRLVGESNAFGDIGQGEQGSLHFIQKQKSKKKSKTKSKKVKTKIKIKHPTVVPLPPDLNIEKIREVIHDRQMLDALVSKEAFSEAFLSLSLKARAAFEEAGKLRSAERLSRELGLALYNSQNFETAEPLLAETASAFCDKGWGQFGLYYSVILADCLNRLGHFTEYADCCLRMLRTTEDAEEKAYFSELLLGTVAYQLSEPVSRPLAESFLSMKILTPFNPPDSCAAGKPLSVMCSVVSCVPRPITVDCINAEFTKVSDGLPANIIMTTTDDDNKTIKINPGMNMFTLKATPNNPGDYKLISFYIQRELLRLTQDMDFDSFPKVVCTKPESDLAFHTVIPTWMPLKTKCSNVLHMHLDTNTTTVKEFVCSVKYPNSEKVQEGGTAKVEITDGIGENKQVASHPVENSCVKMNDINPARCVDVSYPLVGIDNCRQLEVTAQASVTNSNGIRFDFEETKTLSCSVPFSVRSVCDTYPKEDGSALFVVRVAVTSTAQVPLQIVSAVLCKENDEDVYVEALGRNSEPIGVEPQNKANLIFMKTLDDLCSVPPNRLNLQIEFVYNPTPSVQYKDSMIIPIALNPTQPLFNISISVDESTPVIVCEPHDFTFCISRNPMVSDEEIQNRLAELRKAGGIEKLGADQKEGIVVGLSPVEGSWQGLGNRTAVLDPNLIIGGQDWRHTFTLIPLRSGYLPIPILRMVHMLLAKDVFPAVQLYVKSVPDMTCLLTCKLADESGKLGSSAGSSSVVHSLDDSNSAILLQAEERRKYRVLVANADIVVCWFDSASLSQNKASDLFKSAVDKLTARNINVQVNVVTSIDQLLRWMREMTSDTVRAIAVSGKLRIIVSCSQNGSGDDSAALNALLCMAQIPELSFVPIFVQCQKVPTAVASLDNVIFVSDPSKLVSMATVAAKQPELFSPSVLRSSSQSAEMIAVKLMEAESAKAGNSTSSTSVSPFAAATAISSATAAAAAAPIPIPSKPKTAPIVVLTPPPDKQSTETESTKKEEEVQKPAETESTKKEEEVQKEKTETVATEQPPKTTPVTEPSNVPSEPIVVPKIGAEQVAVEITSENNTTSKPEEKQEPQNPAPQN